ncbi:hypothetical protein [Sphingomicrobium marinum]|uniref:hypothetical protein n=1 Tax=Sphingomicrobium marinum TaxID=1227950 RepID=UPI0022402C09|nr:hypothetical protein [Sphingomicrobium marinum]
MESTRTTLGILVGSAIIGGLGLVGYKLVKPQAKPVFVNSDEPATVIAARQIA